MPGTSSEASQSPSATINTLDEPGHSENTPNRVPQRRTWSRRQPGLCCIVLAVFSCPTEAMAESIVGLLSALLAFVPATGSAQREPVALLCKEIKPEPAAEAERGSLGRTGLRIGSRSRFRTSALWTMIPGRRSRRARRLRGWFTARNSGAPSTCCPGSCGVVTAARECTLRIALGERFGFTAPRTSKAARARTAGRSIWRILSASLSPACASNCATRAS
jgi:hypothetical protein